MNTEILGVEISTLLTVYAAVISTIVLVWDVIKYVRDKPNLKVEASWGVIAGGPNPVPIAHITMINTGSRPLTIVSSGFRLDTLSDNNQATVIDPSLPVELNPGQHHMTYANFDEVTRLKVLYAWARDATGRIYTSKRRPLH